MNTMTTVSRFRTIIATALFGAVASSFVVLPAVADSSDPPQVTVKYGDLNIAGPQGAAVLYARIRHAASNVCWQFDGQGLDAYGPREACINTAISGAVTKVNAPALSALYGAKTGKEVPTRLVSR
ncbi:MAG: UrcA family protein [Steroidobacteraceae bacterium]